MFFSGALITSSSDTNAFGTFRGRPLLGGTTYGIATRIDSGSFTIGSADSKWFGFNSSSHCSKNFEILRALRDSATKCLHIALTKNLSQLQVFWEASMLSRVQWWIRNFSIVLGVPALEPEEFEAKKKCTLYSCKSKGTTSNTCLALFFRHSKNQYNYRFSVKISKFHMYLYWNNVPNFTLPFFIKIWTLPVIVRIFLLDFYYARPSKRANKKKIRIFFFHPPSDMNTTYYMSMHHILGNKSPPMF